jgi:protease PrsW
MLTNALILLAAAVGPVILILLWTWFRDRLPEPPGVVLATFVLGALATVPIIVVEWALVAILDIETSPATLPQAMAMAFIVAALVEESFKYLVLARYSAKHSAFDEPYDGIVYGVAASLGFACIENGMYVLAASQGGFVMGITVAILRAATAVPLHTCCGAIMGLCLGIARFKPAGSARTTWRVAGLVAAMLLHGTYNTLAFAGPVAAKDGSPLLALAATGGVLLTTLFGLAVTIAGAARLRSTQRAAPATTPQA